MNKHATVMIGGQAYDALTGLPVVTSAPRPDQAPEARPTAPAPAQPQVQQSRRTPATQLHASTQRSSTLNRKFTKKPVAKSTEGIIAAPRHSTSVRLDVKPAQHPQVRRFAPHPVGVTKPDVAHTPAQVHPHVAKAHAASQAKADLNHRPAAQPTAAEIKRHTVATAVQNAAKPTHQQKTRFWHQRQRVTSIVAATFALVLLGGYFTYLNIPNLSVRVAAAQAGIDAAYPEYRPDGYALNGPVSYSDGRVSMAFKANGSDAKFTVSQSKSGWDSDAVLDNYVSPRAGSSYMPYTERGLTIYTYGNNAAWVNGGILYTIEGDAPLSSDQIRRIATSLL